MSLHPRRAGGAPPTLHVAFLAVASLLFALGGALAVHRLLHAPQTYPQLTVGALAWNSGSKAGDVAAALAFLLLLPLGGWILRGAEATYRRHGHGGLAALQLACVPGIVWAAQAIFSPWAVTTWLYVSVALLGWWAIGSAATSRHRDDAGSEASRSGSVDLRPATTFMLVPLLAGFSALGILYLVNRGVLVAGRFPAFAIGFGIGAVTLWLGLPRHARTASGVDWRSRLWMSQLGIPLLAFAVLPTPLLDGHRLTRVPGMSFALPAFAVLVAIAVLLDVWRVGRRAKSGANGAPISPLALFLCLWVLRSPGSEIPVISTDDWHFGELLLPWASWRDFGLVPYADVIPVRGFISLFDAGLTQLFMTGSAADLAHLRPTMALLYSGFVFLAMRYAAGTLTALVAVAVLDFATPITRIDYLYAGTFALLAGLALRDRPWKAGLFWIASSTVLFLLAPGQGMLFAVATSPIALLALVDSDRAQRGWLVGALAATVALAVALAFASTTLREMALGVRFYFADNLAINTVGSGIPWSESFDRPTGQNPFVREAFRSFFLVVAGWMGWCAVTSWKRSRGPAVASAAQRGLARASRSELAIAACVLFTAFVFLPRVLGRIDVDTASRLGPLTLLVSVMAAIFATRRLDVARCGALATVLIFVATGIRAIPDASNDGATPFAAQLLQVPRQFNAADGLIAESESGLHRVGRARFDPSHLAELVHLRGVIDSLLPPRTPYYDFSNRTAHYVYFDRPVATRWSSPYYLADERAQVRTAEEIGARRLPLLLLSANNIVHDGGGAALRSYWLYRFVLADYVPFERDGYVFAVRKDLASQAPFADPVRASPDDLALFETAFAVTDLKSIPLSWGASAGSLEGSFQAQGLDASLVERDAGRTELAPASQRSVLPGFDMLRLSMACDDAAVASTTIHLRWTSHAHGGAAGHELDFAAASGTLLVPVGSRPAWTMAQEIDEVVVDAGTSTCRVRSARWLKRRPPAVTARP